MLFGHPYNSPPTWLVTPPLIFRYVLHILRVRCTGVTATFRTQRRHELEGAPDPFPSLESAPAAAPAVSTSNGRPDTNSAEAFPSLAPSAPTNAAKPASGWGTGAPPRIKATASKQTFHSDTFTLSVVDLSHAGKDGKPTSLGEVMRQVVAQYKIKLEASTNQKSRQTTFFLKAESLKELDKAKKALLAALSPVVRFTVTCIRE